MKRVSWLVLPIVVLAGCGKPDRAINLEGTAYYFPSKHISGIVNPDESGKGQFYIRLIPPGGYYWLVYDPARESRPNKLGPGIPTITHVSDWSVDFIPKEREVRLVRNEAGLVVCKKNPVNDESAYMRLIFTCGFRIYDNGVPWSVIIPGDLVASAPALKRRAELTLANYRADKRARVTKP
jgi:hypothetical protein